MRPPAAAFLTLALAGCTTAAVDLMGRRGPYAEKTVEAEADAGRKIALIDVQGLLTSDHEESLLSTKESQVVALVEKLKIAEADKNVKAVVVRIDSPGGDVTTSDILYNELVSFKIRKKVPVIAAFMGVAA